jgi:XTP/dITP diphosphohydrolase
VDILLASDNAKKRLELAELLKPLGWRVLGPIDVGGLPAVEEDETTFLGNARKKAISAAAASGLCSLADDSGLMVDCLGGEPGVRSARFAGVHGDDRANNALLLERLSGRPPHERGARFVCALVLARADGSIAAEVEAQVRGFILESPRGSGGFGYDPLFLFREENHPLSGRVFAELTTAEKAAVSHRGRALAELVTRLSAASLRGRESAPRGTGPGAR